MTRRTSLLFQESYNLNHEMKDKLINKYKNPPYSSVKQSKRVLLYSSDADDDTTSSQNKRICFSKKENSNFRGQGRGRSRDRGGKFSSFNKKVENIIC